MSNAIYIASDGERGLLEGLFRMSFTGEGDLLGHTLSGRVMFWNLEFHPGGRGGEGSSPEC